MKFLVLIAILASAVSAQVTEIVETITFTSATTETLTFVGSTTATSVETIIETRVATRVERSTSTTISASREWTTVTKKDYTTYCPSETSFIHKEHTYAATTATMIVITNAQQPQQTYTPPPYPPTRQSSVPVPPPANSQSANPSRPVAPTDTAPPVVQVAGAPARAGASLGAVAAACLAVAALLL